MPGKPEPASSSAPPPRWRRKPGFHLDNAVLQALGRATSDVASPPGAPSVARADLSHWLAGDGVSVTKASYHSPSSARGDPGFAARRPSAREAAAAKEESLTSLQVRFWHERDLNNIKVGKDLVGTMDGRCLEEKLPKETEGTLHLYPSHKADQHAIRRAEDIVGTSGYGSKGGTRHFHGVARGVAAPSGRQNHFCGTLEKNMGLPTFKYYGSSWSTGDERLPGSAPPSTKAASARAKSQTSSQRPQKKSLLGDLLSRPGAVQ